MFFVYWQNNSGGKDVIDHAKGIGKIVVVEAANSDAADERALEIGLYFDPTFQIDCSCCGERWYPAVLHGGESYATYADMIPHFQWYPEVEIYIHYLNGDLGFHRIAKKKV